MAHSVVVGLNIKSTPIELLEKLSVHHSMVKERDCEFKAATKVDGAVILSTCNRLEFYATCDDTARALAAIRAYLVAHYDTTEREQEAFLNECVYAYSDDMAVRHLFEVVTGLDSLIVGEAEILGQVARAYKAACAAETTDKLMNVWFQRALHLGKRARSETPLGQHPVSVGRIAVDLAVEEFGSVEGKQVLILGAGEVSELTMKYLIASEFPVVMVTNRSFDRAKELADEYGFEAYSISTLETCLEKADVVFSATSSKRFMVDRPMVERIMAKRPERSLMFVDMAMPRDIDPSAEDLDGVSIHNINELRDVADRNRAKRAIAAQSVRQLIEEEVAEFRHWVQSLELVPVISAFRRYADDVKTERLDAALEKLQGLTPSQKHTVTVLATTITNELVRGPVETLNANIGSERNLDYALALQELFGLDLDGAPKQQEQPAEDAKKKAV